MQTENANPDIQEFFKQMYKAHDLVKEIKEMIDSLNQSAESIYPKSNPGELDSVDDKIAGLREKGQKLINERAKFDLFICSRLTLDEREVLRLRCDNGLSVKEISGFLKKGTSTVNRIYSSVENKAVKFLFS